MTLPQAWQSFKDSMYALWIYREPESFSYMRDVDELTKFTSTELDQPTDTQHALRGIMK